MIKTTLLCLGIFIIWKPLVHLESTKSENRILKTGLLLFLGCVLSCGIIIVIFQIAIVDDDAYKILFNSVQKETVYGRLIMSV